MRKFTFWLFGLAMVVGAAAGFLDGGPVEVISGAIAGAVVITPWWLFIGVVWLLITRMRVAGGMRAQSAPPPPPAVAASARPVQQLPQSSSDPPLSRAEPAIASAPLQSRPVAISNGTRWVPAGESISVGPYRFDSGMVYFTDGSSSLEEASLINARLPAGRPARGPEAELGYWSDYARITPNQRAAYLEWLANGRRDADPSVRNFGYLFLFFYGVERRLLVDRGVESGAVRAIADLMQLYAPFGKSCSLPSYTCQLLHFWGSGLGAEPYAKFWPWVLDLPSRHIAEDDLTLILANLFETRRNLPVEIAYEIATRHELAKRSTVLKRVPEEFLRLFQTRYNETYPDGLVLRRAKRDLRLEYRPASPSLLQMNGGHLGEALFTRRVANVPGIPSQFSKLAELWNGCVEDLSAYSRAKAKRGDGFSIKAHASLPAELRTSIAHPLGEKWLHLLSKHDYASGGFALLRVSDLAVLFGQEHRPKLTAAQAFDIGMGVETLHFTTEPDLKAKDVQVRWEDEVGVFSTDKADTPMEFSPVFLAARAFLTLCYSIAAADGDVGENELGPVRAIIEKAAGLHETEHKRLLITEQLLAREPTRAVAAAAKVAKLIPDDKRDIVAGLLVHVACADGIVTKDERKALLRVFKEFEFGAAYLDKLIGKALRGFEEAEVIQAGPSTPGEAIPQPADSPPKMVRLDFARIATITKETQEVIAVLSAVMVEENEEVVPTASAVVMAALPNSSRMPPSWVESAPVRYREVILALANRTSTPRREFDALCAEFHVMPSGAFDAINEWAEDTLGDFLLTDEDPMAVATELLPKEEQP